MLMLCQTCHSPGQGACGVCHPRTITYLTSLSLLTSPRHLQATPPSNRQPRHRDPHWRVWPSPFLLLGAGLGRHRRHQLQQRGGGKGPDWGVRVRDRRHRAAVKLATHPFYASGKKVPARLQVVYILCISQPKANARMFLQCTLGIQ
jgi:hypothetical protein